MTVCVYSFYHIIGEEDTTRFFLSTNYQVTHVTSPCSPSSQMLAIVGRPAAPEQPRAA